MIFIYRDDYYNPPDSASPPTRPGEADLIIAKNRNGPVGTVTLTFRPEYPRFMGYTRERFAERAVGDVVTRRAPAPTPLARSAGGGPPPRSILDPWPRPPPPRRRAVRVRHLRRQRLHRSTRRPNRARLPLPPAAASPRAAPARSRPDPKRYRAISFEHTDVIDIERRCPTQVRELRAYVADIGANLDAGRGLWLTGSFGTGKTALAMIVSKAAIDAGRSSRSTPARGCSG